MDLRQLKVLVAIADHRSFSAAAAALHTVQSNVSSHVSHLESELGVQLVDRQTGEVTEEGHAVVMRARRIAAELEAVVSDVAALHHDVAGTVHMGMIGTTARWLAPLLLDRLAERHPRVRLVIGDGTSATLEPQLLTGALDAAVVNLPHSSPDLVEEALFEEDLILVVPAGHRLAGRSEVKMADLDAMELILPAPHTAYRAEIDEAAKAASIELIPKAEIDGLRLIASLTIRGYGPAILPATATAETGSGHARITVEGLPQRKVGVVLRRRARPSAAARAMLEVLQEVVKDNLDPSDGLHPPG
ncbi:MAG: LysR family transcriptional regulator [Acidimicrobiales bacterium]